MKRLNVARTEDIRRFLCNTCGRSYKNKRSLSSHKKIECGKPPRYYCNLCPRGFFYKSKLMLHTVQHYPV
ncbi:unnamed protein product [Nezara viridula]|uniref:C2H2-type domain-containing protein n=1 Tax=Nezara viridula TaxID=85310 RepID=A0A9P0HC12_NEZVI|nr:unnamed protein product [Nezara viridula]